jgi:hypothetical protein
MSLLIGLNKQIAVWSMEFIRIGGALTAAFQTIYKLLLHCSGGPAMRAWRHWFHRRSRSAAAKTRTRG